VEIVKFAPRGRIMPMQTFVCNRAKESFVDVMQTSVDVELDRLIEKRAAVNDPEAAEMLWNGSVRRHHEAIRRRNRVAWFAYFRDMEESHARISQDYARRAEALCEEGEA
jgi:hypothetical protein